MPLRGIGNEQKHLADMSVDKRLVEQARCFDRDTRAVCELYIETTLVDDDKLQELTRGRGSVDECNYLGRSGQRHVYIIGSLDERQLSPSHVDKRRRVDIDRGRTGEVHGDYIALDGEKVGPRHGWWDVGVHYRE